jgi:hypothetical protein
VRACVRACVIVVGMMAIDRYIPCNHHRLHVRVLFKLRNILYRGVEMRPAVEVTKDDRIETDDD